MGEEILRGDDHHLRTGFESAMHLMLDTGFRIIDPPAHPLG